jgi:thioredoxin reductase (NADPH)
MNTDDILDCLVIGAGPGGLACATYLVRYHRRILVLDAGKSRARWIPTSHNVPGFPQGIHGTSLLQQQRDQATGYGATIEDACVARLCRDGDVFEACAADGRRWRARFVILATGIEDVMPPLSGLEEGIASGAVRLCPVCDAYEASDCRVAIYGNVDEAVGHALFLRTFSTDVCVVASDESPGSDEKRREAEDAGITLHPMATALAFAGGKSVVRFPDGREERFDTIYPTLGSRPHSGLAVQVGARCDDKGEILTDDHQQTSVDGVYAVGDVVSALNQIAVAVGHAAIASTAIHNRLPRNWRERPELQAETAQQLPSPEGTIAAVVPKHLREG